MSSVVVPAAAPRLLRAGAPPPGAVPLLRFTDRCSVADLVTVAVGESAGYRDDVPGGTLAVFESVVDAVLLRTVAGTGRGLRSGVPLDATLVHLDRGLRLEGLWTVRGGSRRHRVRPEKAVRRVVAAFAPFVRGGVAALTALAAARAHVVTEHLSIAAGRPAAG